MRIRVPQPMRACGGARRRRRGVSAAGVPPGRVFGHGGGGTTVTPRKVAAVAEDAACLLHYCLSAGLRGAAGERGGARRTRMGPHGGGGGGGVVVPWGRAADPRAVRVQRCGWQRGAPSRWAPATQMVLVSSVEQVWCGAQQAHLGLWLPTAGCAALLAAGCRAGVAVGGVHRAVCPGGRPALSAHGGLSTTLPTGASSWPRAPRSPRSRSSPPPSTGHVSRALTW